ncbi:hypothetical protein EDD53_0396 [Pacificibacter maritimus]|uniref:Uncharacterized protein n=2 Tax=Pacificibacter maritimus TaxID=762213 RepID=A0A3N4VBR8_9RHOB|nr:hypothetical protein EDD53_0396 [Pacificibacter maritimus]
MVIVASLTLSQASAALAAPSCRFERWVTQLDKGANTYVASIGTDSELEAARNFRQQMQLYSRDQLLQQIDAADLGANKAPMLDFISARHHLLTLIQNDWPQMARRYGTDARFIQQSTAMTTFFAHTYCDPLDKDHLNDATQNDTFNGKIAAWVMISALGTILTGLGVWAILRSRKSKRKLENAPLPEFDLDATPEEDSASSAEEAFQ